MIETYDGPFWVVDDPDEGWLACWPVTLVERGQVERAYPIDAGYTVRLIDDAGSVLGRCSSFPDWMPYENAIDAWETLEHEHTEYRRQLVAERYCKACGAHCNDPDWGGCHECGEPLEIPSGLSLNPYR